MKHAFAHTVCAGIISLSILCAGCLVRKHHPCETAQPAPAHRETAAPAGPARTRIVPDPSRPLSLADAVRVALANNPDMDTALSRIRQSEAMIDEALAAFHPRLGAYVEHVRGDSPSGYLFKAIDRRQLPPGVDFNAPGRFRNYEAGMRASFNLFNGGRDVLARRMAETALRVQELDRRNIENALISSLIRTYYNTRAARDYIDIATESVATVESELKLMRVRYRAGGALKSDVLSLEVRLAQTREDVVRAENGHSLALASLADILGLDPDLRLAPTGEGDVPMEVPAEYEAGIPRALASRPELMKVREELLRSRMGIDSARAGYLPRVDARASYYMDDADAGFETSRDNWIAGIILNWDLYTGRSTDARVRKASHLLDEMRAADRKTVQSIRLDVKTAYLKLNEARARVAVTEAGVAQAEESLRLVRKQFEGGSATITRYLDAELARNRARLNAVAAFYDRQTAVADVGRAVGLWAEYAQGVLTDVH